MTGANDFWCVDRNFFAREAERYLRVEQVFAGKIFYAKPRSPIVRKKIVAFVIASPIFIVVAENNFAGGRVFAAVLAKLAVYVKIKLDAFSMFDRLLRLNLSLRLRCGRFCRRQWLDVNCGNFVDGGGRVIVREVDKLIGCLRAQRICRCGRLKIFFGVVNFRRANVVDGRGRNFFGRLVKKFFAADELRCEKNCAGGRCNQSNSFEQPKSFCAIDGVNEIGH